MDKRFNTGISNKNILERDKRIAALKALVSRLAHDFNNSIAPLLGWFSIIQAEAGESSEIGIYAAKGEQIARSSEQMLQDIMNAVKPERSFHQIQTDFKKIIEDELLVLQKSIPLSVNLDIESKIEECTIITDPSHWRKAISNLLNNARYGLALGGRLRVN
jgi:signal transduction histidine kinase